MIEETMEPLKGGCYCGRVRYEVHASSVDASICHCSICRRTTGAPLVAWFGVRRSEFRFVAGEPARFRSSKKATRSFCPDCGTQLTFEHSQYPNDIDITTCSLDDPEKVPPQHHIYTSSKIDWIVLGDGRPEYRESRQKG